MSIDDLYQEHFTPVYKFFYFKTCNQTNAEDLTSQTFLIMVEKMYDDDVHIQDHKKFLYGIMRNVWLRYLQDKYRRQEKSVEDIEDFEMYVHSELERETKTSDEERVRKYVERLPSSQRRIMLLRLVEHQELNAICKALDKDMNYVKTTQKRAIKNLRQMIADEHLEVSV
jgi:RNA polymerase sigma-70 factor, ECF subfamily